MKRFSAVAILACLATALSSQTASADLPGAYGFLPYGFYQPYGARYGSTLRTPPYFATNPPVYYGARHARPYGLSPFASPPLVSADNSYRSRLQTRFVQPPVRSCAPHCNPYVQPPTDVIENNAPENAKPEELPPGDSESAADGKIRLNPFATDTLHAVAKK